jgi:AraC-like DNA-binding protein
VANITSSYASVRPDAVRQSSVPLGWNVICNFDILSPFKQPPQIFDEHHLIINFGRSPGRVRHVVKDRHARHEFDGVVKSHELVFVPAGSEVSWALRDAATAVSIRVPRTFFASVVEDWDVGELCLRPQVPARVPSVVAVGRKFLDTLRAADKVANQSWCKVKAAGLALELVAEMMQHFSDKSPAASAPPKTAREKVREFIASKFLDNCATNPPDLATSAKMVGVSLRYFARLFTEQNGGLSHDDHVMCVRMEQAKVWLRDGKPIKEIARDLCFDDINLSHFYTVFQKHTGMTPGEYRDARR